MRIVTFITVIETWLAVTPERNDARLTISEMQKVADYTKNICINVPDVIFYAFDKVITSF